MKKKIWVSGVLWLSS